MSKSPNVSEGTVCLAHVKDDGCLWDFFPELIHHDLDRFFGMLEIFLIFNECPGV